MASNQSSPLQRLKDESTCPVCLELFLEPQSLSCIHNICLKCAKEVAKHTQVIQCPECRQNTPMKDLKSDFKTANFVDSYRLLAAEHREAATKQHLQKPQHLKKKGIPCQLCEEKPALYKCAKCSILVCQTCRRIHVKTSSCLEDDLVTLVSVVTQTRQELQEQKAVFQMFAAKEQKNFDDDMNKLEYQRQDALKAIDQQEKEAVQHFRDERQKVNSKTDETKNIRKAEHDTYHTKIKANVKCISSMEQVNDESMVSQLKKLKEVQGSLQAEIRRMQTARFTTQQAIIANTSFERIKPGMVSVRFALTQFQFVRSPTALNQAILNSLQGTSGQVTPGDTTTPTQGDTMVNMTSRALKRPASPPRPSSSGLCPPPTKTSTPNAFQHDTGKLNFDIKSPPMKLYDETMVSQLKKLKEVQESLQIQLRKLQASTFRNR